MGLRCAQAHLAFIEAQGSLALRAEAHLLLADATLRCSSPPELAARRASVERHLAEAQRCATAAEWWSEAERAAVLLALVRRVCGDGPGCGASSRAALDLHARAAAQRASCVA